MILKTIVAVMILSFAATGICLADEIKGKVSVVNEEKKTVQISGVEIQTADAWIENEQDYPLALDSLAVGDYIEVKGKFIGVAEIKAKKIERTRPECGVVAGKITLIDTQKREIIISGIAIKVPADIWLEGPDHVKIPIELFAPGYKVKCKGDWTGTSQLTAFKVTVD
ncbi:MAG: DUF5666 domain-containing protein [Candidatus Tantalella remota]|nr:DUF5666 domain-containing protein [Candidatus Tantalella remota]